MKAKKLILTKKTIANLDKVQLTNIHGGADTRPTCPVLLSVCKPCYETIPC